MSAEYMPATYTNILDQMLARGAEPGQGGHLEASAAEIGLALARLDSSCWSFLMTEIANVFDMDRAEPLVRETVRRIGRYRGNDMRREVERRGLPLDVQHLLDYWDYNTEEAVNTVEHEREPHYMAFDVLNCSFHDQMDRLCPQPLAIAMCEEVHIAVAREFNPAISVWYPALLTRGESKCVFRFSMPREVAEEAAKQAERASEAARSSGRPLAGERQAQKADAVTSHRTLARQHVIFYHYAADQLARAVGEERAEDIVRRAMRKWGAWRGTMMREDHQKRGWPLNIQTFITYSDDPAAGDAWVAENVKLAPSEHAKDITISPYTISFERMGTGRFAIPFFEEALPAQAKAYDPDFEVRIPMLMERGDSFSRFCYKMVS
jgi:hypothetical protein